MDRHLMIKQRMGEIPANKTHGRLEDLYRRAGYLEKLPVRLKYGPAHPAVTALGCLCGKRMNLLVSGEKIKVWTCPPSGCGRLYIECEGVEVSTYYLAEQNISRNLGGI